VGLANRAVEKEPDQKKKDRAEVLGAFAGGKVTVRETLANVVKV
jgi:hypothetical protein